MYIPLQLRLTCFYVLLLVAMLCAFGFLVSSQASQRAYRDLDASLSSRAASVKLGKSLMLPGKSIPLLPGIAGIGTEGVAIEVLDNHLNLLATTDGQPDDFINTSVAGIQRSPLPWDVGAVSQIAKHPYVGDSQANSMYSTVSYQGQRIRVYTLANNDFGSTHIIQTARSESGVEQSLNELNLYLLLGGAIFTLCALVGGWLITQGVLSRVQRIERAARGISATRSFNQRVGEKTWRGRDELSQLAETFNTMLDTLEQLYHYQQRFVADASHELRAPIASIRCNLDMLTASPDLPPEDAEAALNDARIEAERMGRLVNDLLTLARSDADQQEKLLIGGSARGWAEPIDLDSLLLEVFRQYRHVREVGEDQEPRQPRLLLQHITPARVAGDADQLKQALVALLDNALKYTPSEGRVSLTLTTAGSEALLEIKDTGIGIAPEDIPHIFERFYRADRSRSREQGSSGLGLSIAQSIIRARQGTIEVESTPNSGSTFTVRLPLSEEGGMIKLNDSIKG